MDSKVHKTDTGAKEIQQTNRVGPDNRQNSPFLKRCECHQDKGYCISQSDQTVISSRKVLIPDLTDMCP